AKAGYNPNAAISLWEKMDRLDGAGGASFLSTHPSNSQRIGDMRKNLPAALAVYNKRR
ncbi:MAG: M48 family metalloprotease, partial [Acinetobacter sp.]